MGRFDQHRPFCSDSADTWLPSFCFRLKKDVAINQLEYGARSISGSNLISMKSIQPLLLYLVIK